MKFGGGENKGGAGIPFPQPFFFPVPPERWVLFLSSEARQSKINFRIFFKESFNFAQKVPPVRKLPKPQVFQLRI